MPMEHSTRSSSRMATVCYRVHTRRPRGPFQHRTARRRRSSSATLRVGQAEVIAQHGAFVVCAEQTVPLQCRYHLIDKQIELAWEISRHDVEAITTAGVEPGPHVVDQSLDRANVGSV